MADNWTIEQNTRHRCEQMILHNVWNAANEQTRFCLESKVNLMAERLDNSVSLVAWRNTNRPATHISIPKTNLREHRLTNQGRKIIKGIIKLAFQDGFVVDELNYDDLFLTNKYVVDVWAPNPFLRKWTPLPRREKLDYIRSIGNIIEAFVSGGVGGNVPKDLQLLINYLKSTPLKEFNLKVVMCHPSLLCHNRLSYHAEYLYHYVMYELHIPSRHQFYTDVTKKFHPTRCGNLMHPRNFFMNRACNNGRISHLHTMIMRLSDKKIANSVFGYLLIMKHGLKHLLDHQSKLPPGNPNITQEEADNWLYIMNPEYLSKLVQTLIELDKLPDSWMLHGTV